VIVAPAGSGWTTIQRRSPLLRTEPGFINFTTTAGSGISPGRPAVALAVGWQRLDGNRKTKAIAAGGGTSTNSITMAGSGVYGRALQWR
jgi:hypothetical protein